MFILYQIIGFVAVLLSASYLVIYISPILGITLILMGAAIAATTTYNRFNNGPL